MKYLQYSIVLYNLRTVLCVLWDLNGAQEEIVRARIIRQNSPGFCEGFVKSIYYDWWTCREEAMRGRWEIFFVGVDISHSSHCFTCHDSVFISLHVQPFLSAIHFSYFCWLIHCSGHKTKSLQSGAKKNKTIRPVIRFESRWWHSYLRQRGLKRHILRVTGMTLFSPRQSKWHQAIVGHLYAEEGS